MGSSGTGYVGLPATGFVNECCTESKLNIRTHDNADGAREEDRGWGGTRRAQRHVDDVAHAGYEGLKRGQREVEVDTPSYMRILSS